MLAGRAAGPDFQRPAPLGVARFTAAPWSTQTVSAPTAMGQEQPLLTGVDVDAQWWRSLGSSRLDGLIEQALQARPTLTSATATLRQAQDLYAAQAGATRYPQVNANLGHRRQRLNPSTLGQAGDAREFSLYNAGIGVCSTGSIWRVAIGGQFRVGCRFRSPPEPRHLIAA